MAMIIWLLAGVCILIALVVTFWLGMNQNPGQNERYVKNRRKTVLWLIIIYAIALVIGGGLVYTLVKG
jgi:hypothetical protein